MGLVVSNMIPVILPWRYVLKGGNLFNFSSKLNLAAYQIILGLFLILVIGTFMLEIRSAR